VIARTATICAFVSVRRSLDRDAKRHSQLDPLDGRGSGIGGQVRAALIPPQFYRRPKKPLSYSPPFEITGSPPFFPGGTQ
jgi:hypothetical protein